MNFSVPRRQCAASSYSADVTSLSSRQLRVGWMFTSMTPGSGVTDSFSMRGSNGGGYPSMRTGCCRSRATSSTAPTSARYSSTSDSGGMKTFSTPSRGSTHSAVRTSGPGVAARSARLAGAGDCPRTGTPSGAPRFQRVALVRLIAPVFRLPRQRVQRQPVAHR